MFEITLTDDTTTHTFSLLSVPLTVETLEGATDVVTLDNSLYTDFTATKRFWTHSWAYLSEADYIILKGFYDRQFSLNEYPLLTIDRLDVTSIPVRMKLNPQSIINNCGLVQNAQATFREA